MLFVFEGAHRSTSGRARIAANVLIAAAGWLAASLSPAAAHPHVFVDAKAEVVFDAKGRITAIRNIWRFDDAYSAFASQGLDKNGDGKLSVEELQPLADLNVKSMPDYAFFTFLTAGDKDIDFDAPVEYWLQADDDNILTLYFTLPTKGPVEIRGLPAKLEIYDPTYFVAFDFVDNKFEPLTLVNPPKGCTFKVFRPEQLDATTAATLAQIPADQRSIPSDLQSITSDLTNGADISCP